jgi:hypothetical protein
MDFVDRRGSSSSAESRLLSSAVPAALITLVTFLVLVAVLGRVLPKCLVVPDRRCELRSRRRMGGLVFLAEREAA